MICRCNTLLLQLPAPRMFFRNTLKVLRGNARGRLRPAGILNRPCSTLPLCQHPATVAKRVSRPRSTRTYLRASNGVNRHSRPANRPLSLQKQDRHTKNILAPGADPEKCVTQQMPLPFFPVSPIPISCAGSCSSNPGRQLSASLLSW